MIYFLAPMARAQPRSVIDIRDAATRDENMKLVRDAVKKHQQLAPESARGEDVDYLVRCSHVSSRSFFFFKLFHQGSTVRSHPRCLDQKTVERPNFHPLFRYDAIHE